MKNTRKILTLLLLFNLSSLFAQQIEWQNTIGGSGDDWLHSISQTSDGGYILGGWSYSNISGDKTENSQGGEDYWVIKLNASGNIQWQNTIGGSNVDRVYSISQTFDGGYIIGGASASNISSDKTENSQGFDDYWVIKLDTNGNIQWQNTIGGSGSDALRDIYQTSDGGYILGGYSTSNISGDKTENSQGFDDYWVIKLDTAGNIQWQNTIGGNGIDRLFTVLQTSDGGYALGGFSTSNISGDKTENSQGNEDYWVVKLDTSGSILWQNTIGGNGSDVLQTLSQTFDGGYIIGGFSNSNISGDKIENSKGYNDYWIVKLDASGNILWQNTIGGSDDDYLYSISQNPDGSYILGGTSKSNISGDKIENSQGASDYWIVKLDTLGSIQWQNTIGGSGDDWLLSGTQTSDGGYVFGGRSNSDISGDKTENSQGLNDYWVVKILSDSTTNVDILSINPYKIDVYPTIATHVIHLSISPFMQSYLVIDLYNESGQYVCRLFNNKTITRNIEMDFDLSFLDCGKYFIRVNQSKNSSVRFIKVE